MASQMNRFVTRTHANLRSEIVFCKKLKKNPIIVKNSLPRSESKILTMKHLEIRLITKNGFQNVSEAVRVFLANV